VTAIVTSTGPEVPAVVELASAEVLLPELPFVPLAGADPTDRTRTLGSTTLVRTAPWADD
jgi:hypothetical protein